MSVSLLVCYFLTEIRKNMGISPSLDEISFWNFLWHSWDIGSLVFTLLGWAYILTFEFLCAGLNIETFDLVTFFSLRASFWDLWSCFLIYTFFCIWQWLPFPSVKVVGPAPAPGGITLWCHCDITLWFHTHEIIWRARLSW